eukprot:scaffold24499_cov109-Isochrysis_galbana.AAC.1
MSSTVSQEDFRGKANVIFGVTRTFNIRVGISEGPARPAARGAGTLPPSGVASVVSACFCVRCLLVESSMALLLRVRGGSSGPSRPGCAVFEEDCWSTNLGRPFRKISVEFSTKRKIAVQFCKISDESTAIWRFFRLRFGVRFV